MWIHEGQGECGTLPSRKVIVYSFGFYNVAIFKALDPCYHAHVIMPMSLDLTGPGLWLLDDASKHLLRQVLGG